MFLHFNIPRTTVSKRIAVMTGMIMWKMPPFLVSIYYKEEKNTLKLLSQSCPKSEFQLSSDKNCCLFSLIDTSYKPDWVSHSGPTFNS